MVCPACAGMIPSAYNHVNVDIGMPRMRGDDPPRPKRRSADYAYAPHARG